MYSCVGTASRRRFRHRAPVCTLTHPHTHKRLYLRDFRRLARTSVDLVVAQMAVFKRAHVPYIVCVGSDEAHRQCTPRQTKLCHLLHALTPVVQSNHTRRGPIVRFERFDKLRAEREHLCLKIAYRRLFDHVTSVCIPAAAVWATHRCVTTVFLLVFVAIYCTMCGVSFSPSNFTYAPRFEPIS